MNDHFIPVARLEPGFPHCQCFLQRCVFLCYGVAAGVYLSLRVSAWPPVVHPSSSVSLLWPGPPVFISARVDWIEMAVFVMNRDDFASLPASTEPPFLITLL